MLDHKDEADHEAADAAHPSQEPQEAEPVVAPFSATESSEMEKIIELIINHQIYKKVFI